MFDSAAAEDDDVRVEHVDDAAERARDPLLVARERHARRSGVARAGAPLAIVAAVSAAVRPDRGVVARPAPDPTGTSRCMPVRPQ